VIDPPARPGKGAYSTMSKQSEKKSVDDKQLAKLAQPLIKEGIAASGVIKKLRESGYSFSGKRVRALYARKPAAKKESAKGAAKGKGKATPKPKPAAKKTAKAEQPATEEAATA
jgi:hypothetical protein